MCPNADLRYAAYQLIRCFIDMCKTEAQLFVLLKLLESCPFQPMRASTVNLLKDRIANAFDHNVGIIVVTKENFFFLSLCYKKQLLITNYYYFYYYYRTSQISSTVMLSQINSFHFFSKNQVHRNYGKHMDMKCKYSIYTCIFSCVINLKIR